MGFILNTINHSNACLPKYGLFIECFVEFIQGPRHFMTLGFQSEKVSTDTEIKCSLNSYDLLLKDTELIER